MRSSKDRTIEKKRRSKAMGAKRTEQSRARRISNKHKRQAIHDIDPSLKVFIMNEKIYDVHGAEIEVIDGKIKPVLINGTYKVIEEKTYNAESDGGRAINDQIEKERIGMFDRLADRFKKK